MPAPKKPRRKTRVWKDDNGWNFEVTHPDGHTATASYLKSKDEAQKIAKRVSFGD